MEQRIRQARIAGFLYLLIVVFGLIAQVFARDGLVNYSNPTITSENIRNSELLFRFGFVSELLMLICDIGVATILYVILRDFSRILSILSTFFRLASIIILSVVALTHYAALYFLQGSDYLMVFKPEQLEALALLSIKLHGAGYNISLFFFGIHLIILAVLTLKFFPFPRTIGILLLIAGLSYSLNSLIAFMIPALVRFIYPAILIPCFIAELTLSIWLLWKGIYKPSIPLSRSAA
jgi:Domain of unknown function (DUF4386)